MSSDIKPSRHYRFPDEVDWNGHFWFSKKAVKDHNWANLPLASKSVYPAIGMFFNNNGLTCPGEKVLSTLTGMTRSTVRKGINGLSAFPKIHIKRYITAHGKRSKKFRSLVRSDNRSSFPFHNCILQGGNWLHLTPSARALYPVMRTFGYFNLNEVYLHDELEETEFGISEEFRELYPSRKWDICEAEVNVLVELSGIGRASFYRAIDSLEMHDLIKRIDGEEYDGWLVYLKPKTYYLQDYLNDQTREKFGYEFD